MKESGHVQRLTPEQIQDRLSDVCALLRMMKRFDGREHLQRVIGDLAAADLELGPEAEPMELIRQYFQRGGTRQGLMSAIQSDDFLTVQARYSKG